MGEKKEEKGKDNKEKTQSKTDDSKNRPSRPKSSDSHVGKSSPDKVQKMQKVIRILGTNLDSTLSVKRGLMQIRGIGFMLSNAICIISNIEPNKKLTDLSEQEIKIIEDSIANPQVPEWMLNRRKDPETGKNIHLVGTSIDLKKREDINILKKIRSYRGIRHELGLPTRGQRTRTRPSKGKHRTVGVIRKDAKQKPKPKEE